MIEINKIYNEDCLTGILKINDNSIDLLLTDAPYLHEIGGMKCDRVNKGV